MLEEGYIKLHRSITKWDWYQDANTARLFIHLLLTVNHYPRQWQGITIERGQIVTSYRELADELRLSIREIRTAVNHLKTTGELTLKTTPKYGLYTINNYDKYQEVTLKQSPERQSSDSQPTVNRQQSKKARKQESKNNIYTPQAAEKNSSAQKLDFESLISSYPESTKLLLRDWHDIRKKKRAAETEKAIQLNLNKLSDLAKKSSLSIDDYLQEIIRRGWQAFYEIPYYGKNKPEEKKPSSIDFEIAKHSVINDWVKKDKEDT